MICQHVTKEPWGDCKSKYSEHCNGGPAILPVIMITGLRHAAFQDESNSAKIMNTAVSACRSIVMSQKALYQAGLQSQQDIVTCWCSVMVKWRDADIQDKPDKLQSDGGFLKDSAAEKRALGQNAEDDTPWLLMSPLANRRIWRHLLP